MPDVDESQIVIFSGIPIPPSVNQCYASFVRRGVINRVPSKLLRDFKSDFKRWADPHSIALAAGAQKIRGWLDAGNFLQLEIKIYFTADKVFTKDGKVKRNDASNRLKAAEDALFERLYCDDSKVFRACIEKRITTGQPQCIIKLRPYSPKIPN